MVLSDGASLRCARKRRRHGCVRVGRGCARGVVARHRTLAGGRRSPPTPSCRRFTRSWRRARRRRGVARRDVTAAAPRPPPRRRGRACGCSVRDKVAAAHDLDHVLRRAEKRHRVQPGVEDAAEESLAPHGRRHRRQRDRGADPRHAARHSPATAARHPTEQSVSRAMPVRLLQLPFPDVLLRRCRVSSSSAADSAGCTPRARFAEQPVDVTILDRRNHHVFQPLLYQVAMAVLSPGDIASPIRWILRHQRNVEVLLGEVARIDRRAQARAPRRRRRVRLRLPDRRGRARRTPTSATTTGARTRPA